MHLPLSRTAMLSDDQTLHLAVTSPIEHARLLRAALEELDADPDHRRAVAAIGPGRFRRDASDHRYAARFGYTAALRRYVYNPAALERIFGDPSLKALFLRTFGYKGHTDFTVYPNAWLRDLPLLNIGRRCYLADGIVLGTNQVSPDQQWLTVEGISIGDDTVFDQQCMVGYGTRIGRDCVIGARVMIGMRARIGLQTPRFALRAASGTTAALVSVFESDTMSCSAPSLLSMMTWSSRTTPGSPSSAGSRRQAPCRDVAILPLKLQCGRSSWRSPSPERGGSGLILGRLATVQQPS